MTKFPVPDPKPIRPLDITNIGGCDEYSSVPIISRSPDMKNIVNRLGMHQVRANIDQTYVVGDRELLPVTENDFECNIKWIGKIEEYDDLGNPIPYYIKISEYLGEKDVPDDSYMYISIWPTPDVRNVGFDMNGMPGCENYEVTYKKYLFTNFGKTGNHNGLYEEVDYDGRTYVFTPIGILSFDCSTTINGNTKTLNFEVKNVLDDPYVPLLKIAGNPAGTQGKIYESLNLLTDKRKYSAMGDGISVDFHLPEKLIKRVNSVKILNDQGGYDVLVEDENYTVNLLTGVVTFNAAPSESPEIDNVIFEYEKSPFEGNETNEFSLMANTTNNYINCEINANKATSPLDNSKILCSLEIKIQRGSKYDVSCNLKSYTLNILAGSVQVTTPTISLTETQMDTIRTGGTLTLNKSYEFANDGSSDSRNWSASTNCEITVTTETTTTTGVPGSVGSNTSLNRQYTSFASYLGISVDARAVPHLGTKADGSDSYWDIYVSPRTYTHDGGYLSCGSRNMYGYVDGSSCGYIGTGQMNGSGTFGNGELYKKIPYSANKTSVSIKADCDYNPLYFNGQYIHTQSTGVYTLYLPSIQPPTQKTTTTSSTSNIADSGTNNYLETLNNNNPEKTNVSYENNAKTSARLACYYATKAVTVYGFENDRRVFVTNGGNCDTFSGNPIDDNYNTITYFPDTNYHVLGEEANILGYAQKAGFLFTVKEGGDSLYVRKGASIGGVLDFPSIFVKRNLQILCAPIEVEGNIFVITRNGLEELSYDYVQDYTYELVTYLRSYYVTNYFGLGADYKYKQMQWYYENGLLHVFLDNYIFVFDINSKSYVYTESSSVGRGQKTGLPYQFETYICTVPRLNANVHAPKVKVYLPKDFERQEYGIVNTDIIPYGYNNYGIYKFDYKGNKIDHLKEISSGIESDKYYPIKAHYYTPFIDLDNTTQTKTIKHIHINTSGENNNEYYIGYVLPDGSQLLLDKIINSASDTQTNFRNETTSFPKVIAIRNKIRKFSSVKLFIKNKADYENIDELPLDSEVSTYNNMTFNRITIQYVNAGKYRGE